MTLPTREEIAAIIRSEAIKRYCAIYDGEGFADALLARLGPAWEELERSNTTLRTLMGGERLEIAVKERDAFRADLKACAEALKMVHGNYQPACPFCARHRQVTAAALARPGVREALA